MLTHSPILRPVVVLVFWTLVMLIWLTVVRAPAMRKLGVDFTRQVGGVGSDLNGRVDPRAVWPAQNYTHLLEQPTLFYAVTHLLAIIGQSGTINTALAWAYVLLRIVHSIVQATINRVVVRFSLFLISTFCLAALTLHAAIAVFR